MISLSHWGMFQDPNYPADQETCKHPPHRRNGYGNMSSYTGAGNGKWTCLDCGLTREWATQPDPKRVQQLAQGGWQ